MLAFLSQLLQVPEGCKHMQEALCPPGLEDRCLGYTISPVQRLENRYSSHSTFACVSLSRERGGTTQFLESDLSYEDAKQHPDVESDNIVTAFMFVTQLCTV